jgi:hypothetical protein
MKTRNVTEIKIGGAKRKNGHKLDCICHICENIKNKAKRGGYEKDAEIEIEKKEGGPKKKNGHRKNCNCPICINMKHAKKGKNNIKTIRTKLGGVKNKTCKVSKGGENDEDLSYMDAKKTKGNNHKLDCKCPICKNMRKKGGQEPKLDEQIKNTANDETEQLANSLDYDNLDKNIGGTRKKISNGKKKTRRVKV